MASVWKYACFSVFSLLLPEPSTCLDQHPGKTRDAVYSDTDQHQDGVMTQTDAGLWFKESVVPATQQFPQMLQAAFQVPGVAHRRLLQMPGAAVPFPPLRVMSSGQTCIMFQARKVALSYRQQKQLDLTERAFSPQNPVDTSQSVCSHDRATLVMTFGDVEDLKGLSIRLQLSNTFYESSGQWWFSVDSVSLLFNITGEAVFNVTEVYAPTSSSYHCLHVSNLQRHSALLLPTNDPAHQWTVTFTDFQIQAFNITSPRFSAASDCATFLTPAILMGLITSLILLLVLAYGLHMVIHLKHIEHNEDQKAHIYFLQNADQSDHGYMEDVKEKNIL